MDIQKIATRVARGDKLDSVVQSLTAYNTFEDLVSACQDGYTPTLTPGKSDSPSIIKSKKALADALLMRGCKTYMG